MKAFLKIKDFIIHLFKSTKGILNQRSTRSLRFFPFFIFITIVLLVLVSVLKRIKKNTSDHAINTIQTSLSASHSAIKNIWAKTQFNDATIWADNSILIHNTQALMKLSGDPELLVQSLEMTLIRTYFGERLHQHDALDIFIISPDFINIASMKDKNVGRLSLLSKKYKNRLENVFKGCNQIIPPIASDMPLADENSNLVYGYPTMFIVVPMKDTSGSIIAALGMEFNPFHDFSLMTRTTQTGYSGEIYAINKDGELLTESRFLDDLYITGLLTNEKHGILNIEIRDPGVNLLRGLKSEQTKKEQPFTYSVEQAIQGKSGFSSTAYRDYRGVMVLGAWLWDDELGIGFVSEIDEQEAMAPFKITRILTAGLLAITILLMLVLGFIYWKSNQRNVKLIEQKERYFRTLLNNAINGIVIINDKGLIETFNRKAEGIFGYKLKEVLGKNVSMLANENDRKQHDDYIHNYLETRKPKIIGKDREVTGIRKDGSLFPMLLGVSEILFEDRIVFMGQVTDLSQQKKTEERIFDVQEKTRLIFEQTPIGIAITDVNNKFNKVNVPFYSLLGYSEKELLKMSFGDITFPINLQKSLREAKKIKEGVYDEFSIKKRFLKKDGDLIWCKVTISSLIDTSGKRKGNIIILEDITVRKQIEDDLQDRSEELERSNIELNRSRKAAINITQDANVEKIKAENALKKFSEEKELSEQTINSMPGIFFISNRKGELFRWNNQYERFIKLSANEIKIKKAHAYDIIVKKDRAHAINRINKIKRGITIELKIQTSKEETTPYLFTIMLTTIANEEYLIATGLNISDRKILEKELITSKDEALKANKAKSNFLANMSHEIRTPMNAILGFSEILSKHIKDNSQLGYLESIQTSGKTLLTLINNILDLSKIESGKFGFNYEAIHMKQLIQEVINMLKVKAEEKGLELKMTIVDTLPTTLVIDELRIKQILINLINNAIKFTDQGFVEVEVSTQNITNTSLDLVLKVKDSGIGIPKENHKNIFQAFDQVHMQDNKKFEGTGLGLAIAQQLAKLMHGTIKLQSKEGEGSTFTITFKKVKIGEKDTKVDEKIEFDFNLVRFENATVLLVDDIKTNRDLLKEYMKGHGIKTIEAENGVEALVAIKKHKPDLIFLDLRMPIMDGFEANDTIKKNPDWSHIPIIAITASVFNKDEQKVVAKGFNGYVRKPASSKDILEKLRTHLKYTLVPDAKAPITEISFKPIENLNDLIMEIEKKVTPLLEETKKIRTMKKILLLAGLLIEIGEKYKATQLINYGEELHLACKSFNISKEKKLVQLFPQFIENLNSPLNGKQ